MTGPPTPPGPAMRSIGSGNKRSSRFDSLRALDDPAVPARRPVDNAGSFRAGDDPRQVPDAEPYDRLAGEFPHWLTAATARGSVR
ncbi:VWA domain-containing protein [Streptomyces fulvorobeus]|uniref:vWA found in TerF C terminus domain-containing protein n=1 Tax=Streptomyces fulvorobeus TaxID=284028 RepID=A0A7J0C1U6_9ACTN|nr:hypothetical protein [Streptomyces fulvorobeus]GFM96499.1 hypothetical protein Sfulv_13100 [Streptomyces fulvorobeus]